LDERTHGRGWEYAVLAPTQRGMLQALGRMIRSEHDRGIGIVLDRRAVQFASVLPGMTPLTDLRGHAHHFYGRRARLRWSREAEAAATSRMPETRGLPESKR
jgi:hypothetical protein